MSLSLRFLYFIIFLRDRLIYYVLDSVYLLPVELVLVLQSEIKPVSTTGMGNLLSFQKLITSDERWGSSNNRIQILCHEPNRIRLRVVTNNWCWHFYRLPRATNNWTKELTIRYHTRHGLQIKNTSLASDATRGIVL